MMKNKLYFDFNSHRTYNNALTRSFILNLSKERRIDFCDNEFLVYYVSDFKVTIDSLLTVYISGEYSKNGFEESLQNAKNEYELLCSINPKFDKNSPIHISLPKNSDITSPSNYAFNDLGDVLFSTVN